MSNETESKLAEVRAKREAMRAEREARIEAKRAADALADEERLLEVEQAVVDAEAKHGDLGRGIALVHARRGDGTIAGSIILKKPHAATFRKFQDKGSTKTADFDAFVRPCVVWPESSTVDRLLEEYPATLAKLADAAALLAGATQEDTSGKS